MELVVLIGLQGAGKSTFYRSRFAATHALVSRDLFPNNRNPGRRQRELVEEAFVAGRSVVIDNTNGSPLERRELCGLARAFGARAVGYAFPRDIKTSLARNATRTGRARVPEVAIFATAKRFVPPVLEEGFEALYEVRAEDGLFELRPLDPSGTAAR